MERQSKINLYQHQLMHLINLDLNIPRESAKMLYYGLRDLFELTDEVEIEKINLKKFISKLKQDAANVEHLRSEEKKSFENQILRSKLKQDSANVEHLRSEEKKSFEKQLLVEKSLNTQQQLQINELLTKCKKLKKLELENESLKSEALKKFENSQLSDKNSDSDSSVGDSGVSGDYESEIDSLKTKLSQVKDKLNTARSENSELQENLAKARNNTVVACAVLPKTSVAVTSNSQPISKKEKRFNKNRAREQKQKKVVQKFEDLKPERDLKSLYFIAEQEKLTKEQAVLKRQILTWEAMVKSFKQENDKLKSLRVNDGQTITGLHSKLEASRRMCASLLGK